VGNILFIIKSGWWTHALIQVMAFRWMNCTAREVVAFALRHASRQSVETMLYGSIPVSCLCFLIHDWVMAGMKFLLFTSQMLVASCQTQSFENNNQYLPEVLQSAHMLLLARSIHLDISLRYILGVKQKYLTASRNPSSKTSRENGSHIY